MTSGTGTCSVLYDQAGSANYAAAPQVAESVAAAKLSQTITVTTHAPASGVFGASFGVAGNAVGGLAVTFSSFGACTNSGSTFTMTSGTGTCSVFYDQAGNANYESRSADRRVGDGAEGVAGDRGDDARTGERRVRLELRCGGQLGGRWGDVLSSGACSNSGSTFTLTSGTGTCQVLYDQAGSSNYNAASQVVESVTAQKANQTITGDGARRRRVPRSARVSPVAATAPGGSVAVLERGRLLQHVRHGTFTMTSSTVTCSVLIDQAGSATTTRLRRCVSVATTQKTSQRITVSTHAPASAVFGTGFAVAATGGGAAIR